MENVKELGMDKNISDTKQEEVHGKEAGNDKPTSFSATDPDISQDISNKKSEDILQTEPLSTAGKDELIPPLLMEEMETIPRIELNSEFSSFIQLRDALETYQKEKQVQLIVKDSKLLKAESTRRIIPKVYHLVNKNLLYHSITYCCKCHGELRQRANTRIKNVGAKRLNCPMYLRFKLTTDLQRLLLFDLLEEHNHDIDPNTFQLPPRQQVYQLSRVKKGEEIEDLVADPKAEADTSAVKVDCMNTGVQMLIAAAIKDVNAVSSPLSPSDYEPPAKFQRLDNATEGAKSNKSKSQKVLKGDEDIHSSEENNDDDEDENDSEDDDSNSRPDHLDNPHSPLDPESTCSDTDEEEFRLHRHLLPYPIRLIGSAIQSSPELLASAKELMDIQRGNLLLEKRKLLLQTKQLELENAKLSLEVKVLEKNMEALEVAASQIPQDTTIFLQAQ